MTKILRNTPWLFLYAVSLHTNSAAMGTSSATMEAQKLIIWQQNHAFIEKSYINEHQRILANERNNPDKVAEALASSQLIQGLNNVFRQNVERGLSCDAAAQIVLGILTRPMDPPLSHTLKKDIRFCFGDSCRITES